MFLIFMQKTKQGKINLQHSGRIFNNNFTGNDGGLEFLLNFTIFSLWLLLALRY